MLNMFTIRKQKNNFMKKIILTTFTAILFLAACSPKASKSAATTTPAAAPAKNPTEPTETSLAMAKTKFPDVTLDVLKKGHSIYYGACTRCHGTKSIERRDEKEWVGILDNMAPKARLLPEEKEAVWKYIMSVKLLSPSTK